MNKSEDIKELVTALVKFRSEVAKINKSAKNPFFNSSYAPLSDIITAVEEQLTKNGLMLLQFPKGENELETILTHTSGQWMSQSYYMRPIKGDPQAYGSVITYMRRYALGAILMLNIDEDDDANSSSSPNVSSDDRPWLTEPQFRAILTRIKNGEDLFEETQNKFRMKKVYREGLESASGKK